MVAQAAQQQKRTQAGESVSNMEYIRRYAQTSDDGGGVFTVAGSRTRGYVPSQAGLLGLNNNRASWQSIYQRCVNETKRKGGSGNRSDKIKALKIAQKIADGKRVPPEDEEFLMKYSLTLWIAAKRLALMKEMDDEMEESELKEDGEEERRETSQEEAADGAQTEESA